VKVAVDFRSLDDDVANVVLVDFGQELRERDVLRGRALTRVLEKREQCQQQQNYDDQRAKIAQVGVHRSSFVVARIAASFPWAVHWAGAEGKPSVGYITSRCHPRSLQGNHADYLAHVRGDSAQ